MPAPPGTDANLWSLLWQLIASSENLRNTVNQLSFGLIQIVPPPGEPSLTSQLNNIVFQIQSLREHLDVANTEMISQNVDILAAIAGLPDGSGPVVLPTTPPTGYGVDTGTIGDAVWSFNLYSSGHAAGDQLDNAGGLAVNLGVAQVAFPLGQSKYFELFGTWWGTAGAQSAGHDPTFPIANILGTDTLDVFLERESGYTGWTANGDGTWNVGQDPTHTDFIYRTTITDVEFLVLRDGSAAVSPSVVAPVWPGVALVTLSTPVAITTGLTISEPMDGVIVSLSGVPTRANFYQFDDKPSYRNLGALAFFDDNGELEAAQTFSFENQVMTPRSMKQAAGVKLRTEGGVSGTLTPWIVTP